MERHGKQVVPCRRIVASVLRRWGRDPGRRRLEMSGALMLVLVSIVVTLPIPAGGAQVVVTLREAAEVPGPKVSLEEIAVVSGSDEQAVERVRHIVVCAAPAPGRSRKVSRGYVERSLRQNDIDPASVGFEGAETVKIITASVVLPGEEIRARVEEYLMARWAGVPEDQSIEFRSVPSSITIARRHSGLRVVAPERGPLKSNVLLYLEVDEGDKVGRRFPVSVRIRTFEWVVVTNRRIDRHHVLEEGDLRVERRETTDLNEVFLDIASTAGFRASRVIPSGRVVLGDMVERPPLINRGDIVAIVVTVGSVSATISGEARQDGRKGDRIRVRNLRSGKELIARILDAKTVEVEAGE